MPDSTRIGQTGLKQPVRPTYKIACYVAAWLAALFATNPNGGLWALAWMFPLGLAAFINAHWGNSGGWGVLGVCIGIYLGEVLPSVTRSSAPLPITPCRDYSSAIEEVTVEVGRAV